MKAGEFWDYCDRLRATRSGNQKGAIVQELIRDNEAPDVNYALRLMLGNPFENPEMNMGVGKKTVRKAMAQAFNVSYDEIREEEKAIGNLSEVAEEFEVPTNLLGEPHEPTLRELISDLGSLSRSSRDTRIITYISDMYGQYTHPQVVTFAILSPKKDVSLGIGWKKVRDACVSEFSVSKSEFERAHGLEPDAGTLARKLKDGVELPQSLEPGMRFTPMLASSVDLPDDETGWVGQTKYDGGRLIIHHTCGSDPGEGKMRYYRNIQAFTRNRRDIAGNLPELHEINWPQTDFIVDAEAVGYDPETGEVLPFQQFMERFQREKDIEAKSEEVEIRFKLFDLLYWENHDTPDLTNLEYEERLTLINQNFGPDQLRIDYEALADTWEDLDTAYEESLANGHEGIIAKRFDHKYVFDRSRSWRKVKPVKEPIDLKVAGVVSGTGRRVGTLGALMLETQDGEAVGRVGTGFTDPELDRLWKMHQNGGLIGETVQIKFEEFQERNGKYGLRFPRYEGLRPDGEADTLERVKNL